MASIAEKNDEPRRRRAMAETIFGYVWRVSARPQVLLCLLAAIIAPLSMVPLELQRRIINDAIGGFDLTLLYWLGGAYAATALLQGLLKFTLRLYRGMVSERVIRRLRRQLFQTNAANNQGHEATDAEGDGSVVSMVSSEVEQVGGFVGESFSEPFIQAGTVIAVLGYMMVVEPLIALVSLAFYVPQIIVVPWLQRFVNRLTQKRIELIRELGDQVVADGEADGDSTRDDDEHTPKDRQNNFENDLKRIYRNRIRLYCLKFIQKFFVNMMHQMGPLSVLIVGGYLAIQGETTIGVIVAFISGFDRMADPSRQLVQYYRTASTTQVKYKLLATFLDDGKGR